MGHRYLLLAAALLLAYIPCRITPAVKAAASAASNRSLLTFTVLSDIQIQYWHKPSQDKLRHALRDLAQTVPETDAMIINGDLTEGGTRDYEALRGLMEGEPHPKQIFYTIGNHEYYQAWYDRAGHYNPPSFPNGETDTASKDRFLAFAGLSQVYYERVLKGYTFLFLGSEQYRQSDPGSLEDAYLSADQLNWLEARLAFWSKSGRPIFIFLHQPLPNTVAGTAACCTNNRAVVQHEALKAILDGYPQAIFFSGHTHLQLKSPNTMKRNGFTAINSSSVAEPWKDQMQGNEAALDPGESEGLYVEVYQDRTVVTGRDFYRGQWIPEALFVIRNKPMNGLKSR